ncbi:SigE family RNA polymerase sigma factor [Actinospica sp. MGRD01-02]|uniref:SigE family RNA polymerase sigma factor n=1 Tax=Actinospica acidithermotolerans TaxID=2828514 RepID=A0A941E987_9ACTN|nr:SigE family RNA polymerase sigma factor [Actinospica acidithermotolerans]MBR7826263.1 SigE family RNA polymerase sigma factor [Actinospica acidithermotolerans]
MGDHDAFFVGLIESRYNALVRSAYLLTGNVDSARDLVQAALTKAYAKRVGMRDPGAMEGYVRRTIVNLHISSWRRHRGREATVAQPPEPVSRRVAGEPEPAPLADQVAAQVDLWRALQTLTPRQRTAVVLRYFEDLPVAEVARLMDCGEQSVKTHTARALANLRDRLGAHEVSRIESARAAKASAGVNILKEAEAA